MRFIDRPDRPTEIDGYKVNYNEEKGSCWVDRPQMEQQGMRIKMIPLIVYIAEKWGYCPIVGGSCMDSTFLLAKELPIKHCNDVREYDCLTSEVPFHLSFEHMNGDTYDFSANAVPINPLTRELILTMEAAEALDLSEYDLGEPITKNYGHDGDGEAFQDMREFLERSGYQPPKVKYWDTVREDEDDDY